MRKSVIGAFVALSIAASASADCLVLAVPTRQMVLNFGFDAVRMAPSKVNLVCYGAQGGSDDVSSMQIDLFDAAEWRWYTISPAQWAAGTGLASGPKKLVAVGSGAMAEAVQRVYWTRDIQTVSGERLADVANIVGSELKFTPAQWKSLAKTYGFTIEDHNAELRRIGRRRMKARREAAVERREVTAYPPAMTAEVPAFDAPPAERPVAISMPLADIVAEREAAEARAAQATPDVVPPAVKTPDVEPPAVKTPDVVPPAVKTPDVEPPAVKTPDVEPPAAKTPDVQAQEDVPVIVIRPVGDNQ